MDRQSIWEAVIPNLIPIALKTPINEVEQIMYYCTVYRVVS